MRRPKTHGSSTLICNRCGLKGSVARRRSPAVATCLSRVGTTFLLRTITVLDSTSATPEAVLSYQRCICSVARNDKMEEQEFLLISTTDRVICRCTACTFALTVAAAITHGQG